MCYAMLERIIDEPKALMGTGWVVHWRTESDALAVSIAANPFQRHPGADR